MTRFLLLLLLAVVIACSPDTSSNKNPEVASKDTTVAQIDTTNTADAARIEFDSANYNYLDGVLEATWPLLAQVEFEEQYNEEIQAYVPYPKFDPLVRALDGKDIIIQGYLIPVDESGSDDSILVLSANPFSSCFFCGAAGPESVMDVITKKKLKRVKTDQVAIFKGRLKLNDSDLYYLNYILEDAELID